MVLVPSNNWLTNKLKEEVIELFQPLYKHTLTETEITNIANTLANAAELWIKFNWRIKHPLFKDRVIIRTVGIKDKN